MQGKEEMDLKRTLDETMRWEREETKKRGK